MSQRIPFLDVESWLFDLPLWKSQLEAMREQLTSIPGLAAKLELVAIYGQGQKNEAILNQVIRRLELQNVYIPLLEMKINLLEKAICSLQPEERQYVEERYMLRLPSQLVMEKLGMTHRIYYTRRKRTLTRIFRFVGGPKSILYVEYENVATETDADDDSDSTGQFAVKK